MFPSDLRRLLIGWPAFSVCRVSFSGYLSIGGATATGGRLMSLTITDKKKKSVIAYQVGTEHNECNSFNKKKNIPKSTTQVALGTWRRQRKIIKSNIFIFFLDQQIQEKKDPKSPFPSGARFDRRSPSIRHKKNDFFLLKKKSQARRVGGGVA